MSSPPSAEWHSPCPEQPFGQTRSEQSALENLWRCAECGSGMLAGLGKARRSILAECCTRTSSPWVADTGRVVAEAAAIAAGRAHRRSISEGGTEDRADEAWPEEWPTHWARASGRERGASGGGWVVASGPFPSEKIHFPNFVFPSRGKPLLNTCTGPPRTRERIPSSPAGALQPVPRAHR